MSETILDVSRWRVHRRNVEFRCPTDEKWVRLGFKFLSHQRKYSFRRLNTICRHCGETHHAEAIALYKDGTVEELVVE